MKIYLSVYSIISYFYLDRWPLFESEEAFYCFPDISGTIRIPFQFQAYEWIVAKSIDLFGFNLIGIRMPSFIAGLAVLVAFYHIVKMYDKTIASWATVMMSLSHVFVLAHHSGRPDMSLLAFLMLGLWGGIRLWNLEY